LSRGNTDVVIVGAGFAGLAAAIALQEAGVGFVVLEARHRVGGRVESLTNGLGERIDTGGQFLCEDMPELMKLVRAHGKSLVETPMAGRFTAQPEMSAAEAERTYADSMALRDRLNAIDPRDPAIAGLTVADWLERQDAPADTKSAFQSMIEGLWCQPIEALPLWYLIDNDRRVTNEVSELQYFVAETMQSLAEDLASTLGDRLCLSTPANAVEVHAGGVRVSAGRDTWDARSAIVAVPPVAAGRIVFQPALPDDLRAALSAWRSGSVIKILVRYREPFWRRAGRNGMVLWRDVHGLFACDASRDEEHPALVVFIAGPLAQAWRSFGEARLRAEITERLTAALGPEAADMLDMTLRDWCDDRWSAGGYSDVVADAAAADAEAVLRRGAWPVSFACSELSPSFPGYVEGAFIAGRLAAQSVAARLASQ
jgi:monoamine oxidase